MSPLIKSIVVLGAFFLAPSGHAQNSTCTVLHVKAAKLYAFVFRSTGYPAAGECTLQITKGAETRSLGWLILPYERDLRTTLSSTNCDNKGSDIEYSVTCKFQDSSYDCFDRHKTLCD